MKMLQAALVITLAFVVPVKAAIVQLNLDFIGGGFGVGAPADPVGGSFSVTFDNSAPIFDSVTGLTATINITTALPAFSYDPVSDQLLIGGISSGVNAVTNGTDDFVLAVQNASTNPTFSYLDYSQFGIFSSFTTSQGFVAAPSSAQLNLDFTASGFGAGAPVDPVTGSFSVTFDKSALISDSTTGVTATINIPFVGPAAFSYDPLSDVMSIGGISSGASAVTIGTTDDFALAVQDATTNPTFFYLDYSQIGIFDPLTASQGSVTSAVVPSVPEPGSSALLAGGLGLLGLIRLRGISTR